MTMVPDRWTARRRGASSACASHCSRSNTKSGPVVNAIRRGSGHDPSSRAKVSRSGAQHMDSAMAISGMSGGPEPHRPDSTDEGLPVGAIIVAHQVGRRRTGMPPRSVVRATPRSDAGSPQTRASVDVRDRCCLKSRFSGWRRDRCAQHSPATRDGLTP